MKSKKNGPSEDDLASSTYSVSSSTSKFSPSLVNLNWDSFENICTLGTGAFGDVYKVKCL